MSEQLSQPLHGTIDPVAMRRLQEAYGLELTPEAQKENAAVTAHHLHDLENVETPTRQERTHRRATREAGPVTHVEVSEVSNVVKLPVRRNPESNNSATITAEDRRKAAYPSTGRTHRRATSEAGPITYKTEKPVREIIQKTTKNGVKRLYEAELVGVDTETGQKVYKNHKQVSFKKVLEDHGHAKDMQGKRRLKHMESVEADVNQPSMALTAEQEIQLEKAIATGDRASLPVELTDAEWTAATGQKVDAVEPAPEAVTPTDNWLYNALTESQKRALRDMSPAPAAKQESSVVSHDPLAENPFPEDVLKSAGWAELNDEERRNILMKTTAPSSMSSEGWAELTAVERANLLRKLTVDAQATAPNVEPNQLSAKQTRVQEAIRRSQAGADGPRVIRLNRFNRDSKTLRVMAGVLAGAVAVGALFGVRARDGEAPQHRSVTHAASALPNKATLDLGVAPRSEKKQETFSGSVVLKKGDTVWHEGELNLIRQGNVHPSERELVAEMRRIAELNHIDLKHGEDRHMAIGTKIKL